MTQLYLLNTKKLNTEKLNTEKLNKLIMNNYINSSNSDDSNVQNMLGYFYFYGIHTSINYCSALEMFKMAAHKKNKHALYNLSALYRDGICVEKNINKANILLIQASYYGNDLAKFVLAINYVHGNNGFTKNRKKAVEILTELKDKGNLPAKVSLESLKLD